MAQSAYENSMSDLMAENYTQQYPIIPWWERVGVLKMTTVELISKIQNGHNRQKDIAEAYAIAIYRWLTYDEKFDWVAINTAIANRWSRSAIKRIKKAAWKKYDAVMAGKDEIE